VSPGALPPVGQEFWCRIVSDLASAADWAVCCPPC